MWYSKPKKITSATLGLEAKIAPTINITTYFENLAVELHVLYTLNTYVKFYVNRILFTV